MKSINITKEGILEYYGNRVGYVKNDTAFVDLMFKKADIADFLGKENGFKIEWQKDIYDRLIKGEIMNPEQIALKNCRLYQLKANTNVRMRFIGYKELKDRGFREPNVADYKVVYDGNIGTNDLEGIYDRFDSPNKPEGFTEGGIYISDVIELYDENSSEFYYVNPTSFEKLEHFNEPKMAVERKIDKPKERISEKLQNREFEAVKATEPETMKIDTAELEQKPTTEPEVTDTPSEKEESFQVETFRITM